MRIIHLLDWTGGAQSAGAALARSAIRRRPDLEHIVVAIGPSAARRSEAAGLPPPIVQVGAPAGRLPLAAPAVGRAIRAAGPAGVVHAWSAQAASLVRRICPAQASACATALLDAPPPRRRATLRAIEPLHALVTPCAGAAAQARRTGSARNVVEAPPPRLDAAHPAPAERQALRQALALKPDDNAIVLVGDCADDDAMRFIIACALTGASGRRVCALLPGSSPARRRAMRTFEQTRGLLTARLTGADWLELAPAADIGLIPCAHGDRSADAASAVSLSVALGAGLPVVASAETYSALGVDRDDARGLVAASSTRAELGRLAGPLLDDPDMARAMAGAARRAQRDGDAFFPAVDQAWAGTISP